MDVDYEGAHVLYTNLLAFAREREQLAGVVTQRKAQVKQRKAVVKQNSSKTRRGTHALAFARARERAASRCAQALLSFILLHYCCLLLLCTHALASAREREQLAGVLRPLDPKDTVASCESN